MKIAISASFFAERNVDVNTGHAILINKMTIKQNIKLHINNCISIH